MKVTVEYLRGGRQKTMHRRFADVLVKTGLVKVVEAASVQQEPPAEESPEISVRTGKPKRQYKRRDMQAE